MPPSGLVANAQSPAAQGALVIFASSLSAKALHIPHESAHFCSSDSCTYWNKCVCSWLIMLSANSGMAVYLSWCSTSQLHCSMRVYPSRPQSLTLVVPSLEPFSAIIAARLHVGIAFTKVQYVSGGEWHTLILLRA